MERSDALVMLGKIYNEIRDAKTIEFSNGAVLRFNKLRKEYKFTDSEVNREIYK